MMDNRTWTHYKEELSKQRDVPSSAVKRESWIRSESSAFILGVPIARNHSSLLMSNVGSI